MANKNNMEDPLVAAADAISNRTGANGMAKFFMKMFDGIDLGQLLESMKEVGKVFGLVLGIIAGTIIIISIFVSGHWIIGLTVTILALFVLFVAMHYNDCFY